METPRCKFFRSTGCKNGDNCQYRHVQKKNEPCRNIQTTGDCRYGDGCDYLHQGIGIVRTKSYQAPVQKTQSSPRTVQHHPSTPDTSLYTRMEESPSTEGPLFIFPLDYKQSPLSIHEAAKKAMGTQWTQEMMFTIEDLVDSHLQSLEVQNFIGEMGLDLNEAGAVTYYTSDVQNLGGRVDQCLYFSLNKMLALRSIPDNWKPFLYFLLQAVYKLPNLEATVYRALNKPLTQLTKKYRDNNIIDWVAFSSTSTNKEILIPFSESVDYGTWICLNVTQGKDITPLSLHPSEGEVLLLPNSKFKVLQVLNENTKGLLGQPKNMDIITMEQLPSKDGLMVKHNITTVKKPMEKMAVSFAAGRKDINPTGIVIGLDQLRVKPYPVGVDVKFLEAYLSVVEFKEWFKTDPKSFYNLPKWKQDLLKKEIGLF